MITLGAAETPPKSGRIKFEGYEWRLELPCSSGDHHHDWLDELSEMRGRIIFDHGHRPAFQQADGSFTDLDPVDAFSYHVTARVSGKLVGCARLLKSADAHTNWTESLLGAQGLEQILNKLKSATHLAGEAGRWIVAPEHRGQRVGRYLMAGVYATARWLRLCTILGWSGTHERQDRAFMSMGWQPVDGFERFPAPQFDDEVRLMYFDVPRMKSVQIELSNQMAQVLELNQRVGGLGAGV